MRTFKTSKAGVTITDEAHGVKSVTHLSPLEAEQKASWLGAMGYPADVMAADLKALAELAAKPLKPAKSKPAKRGKK